MNRLFLFSTLFFFLFAVNSCSRDSVVPESKAVKGEWQWVYSASGMGGNSLQPINNTLITLSLNSDSTYVFYLNNESQVSGRYSIQTQDADSAPVLHLDQGIQINMLAMQQEQMVITWDSSQLQLLDNNITDGFKHFFKKVE